MKQETRAQYLGVSTKRLRRMASIRIEKMECTVLAIEHAWTDTEDPSLDAALHAIRNAITNFSSDLAGIAEYLEEPVEGIRP